MGLDNQLFTFIRDGQHEGMAITILGSPRSVLLKTPKHEAFVNESVQTRHVRVDRDTGTRDMPRERLRQRYSRDIDVRYLSWKSLKEKLLSAYSCNQQQCPMIKERLIQHHQSIHGGRRCEKKCSLSASRSKNCVSIKAGPDYDQYSDEHCTDCPMPHTSSNYYKNIRSRYLENSARPIKGNLKTDRTHGEGRASSCITTVKNESLPPKNRYNERFDTSFKRLGNKSSTDNCCEGKDNTRTTYDTSYKRFGSKNSEDDCCDNRNKMKTDYETSYKRSSNKNSADNCFDDSNNMRTTYDTSFRRMTNKNSIENCCDENDNMKTTYGASYNTNLRNKKTNSNDCCDEFKKGKNVENTTLERNVYSRPSNFNMVTKTRNNNDLDCCDLGGAEYNRYDNVHSERYVDSCSSPCNVFKNKTVDNANDCCDLSGKPVYADSCTGYNTSYRNACTDNDYPNAYSRGTRYMDGCTTPYNSYCTSNENYVDGCYYPSNRYNCNDNYATCSSYIGKIEAPKFALAQSNKADDDCQPSTSKNCASPYNCKTDRPTNTPIMVDNASTCAIPIKKCKPCKKLYTVDEGCDSIMSSILSIVKNRKNCNNKLPITYKNNKQNKGSVEGSTSYSHKPIPPYAVDNSSNSKSDSNLSIKSNGTKHRKNSNSNPIYREVNEWIREVPLHPGLEKEDKDKNTHIINDLVKNLYKLSTDTGHSGNDEKIRNEIEASLNKMPIWYPEAKKDQSGFRRGLIDQLTQRLKNANRKNTGTKKSSKKANKKPVTEVRTSLTLCNPNYSHQFKNDPKDVEIKIRVIDWLRLIISKTYNNNTLKKQLFVLADFIAFRTTSLLNKPFSTINLKVVLKAAILNMMTDLPIIIDCPMNKDLHVQDLAEDLTNKLLSIQTKYSNDREHSDMSTASRCNYAYLCHDKKESIICSIIRECFGDAGVDCNNTVIEQALVIFESCYDVIDPEAKRHARNKIMNLLITSTNLSELQAWNLAKIIIKTIRKVFNEDEVCTSSQTGSQFRKSLRTSVLTSLEEAPITQTYIVTSTPKKKKVKHEISKLNPLEIQYMEDVSNLVREWMTTLPETFSAPEEKEFKETMIKDLAGDLMDEAKLSQLAPDSKKDKKEIQKYIVCRWIFRLEAFEIHDVNDEIEAFLDKLDKLPIPVMTQPQLGNRQAMENLKFYKGSKTKWADNFVPKAVDVLEDEISIWMHEQPSDIFIGDDVKSRHDKIHELAQVLENKTGQKCYEREVSEDIGKWLNQVIKPEKRREIGDLREDLKDRVIDLPNDATLAGIVENRSRRREEHRKSKLELVNTPKSYATDNEPAELDNTMAMFISKFIEHHYDIDDPLARRAFNRLLNGHLITLSPPKREEIYVNFAKKEEDNRFPPHNVIKELEYIKDISDWLKNLPIDPAYNSLGNRERIDFVNSLALSIREAEEEREKNPDGIDYDTDMIFIILEHMKLLPLSKEYEDNIPFMIGQLFDKIIAHRQDVIDAIEINESINSSGINRDNIGDFIEEFIRINGTDIAHDEMKMEAWAIRLIREIKKILPNISNPSTATCKADVYTKFMDVPIPSDETVEYFNLELDYVTEITNWMKNLPLIPMNDTQKDRVTEKICQLAETIVEIERKFTDKPNEIENNKDLKHYIEKWISELPLDKKHEIILPVLIQQFMNRIKKLKQKDESLEIKESESAKNTKEKKGNTSLFGHSKKNTDLSSINLTDAIEKWSKALPVKTDNEDATKNLQNDISRKIFQEVGQLNMNPLVNNDEIMYESRLEDEINTILDDVPQNDEIKIKKGKLKDDIVKTIIQIRNNIKEKTAGNTYKLELQKTIDGSIPNPVPCNQVYDPGFEIYKDRLAAAFILENFDHGSDDTKAKYQNLLKKEIDNYFDHARNRNGKPLSRDQLYNELYSALYKVPVPNEASVIVEVEKVKTRCEIDAWFEELPLRESNGLTELLDCDKLLATLATRIYEIETSESKPDDKIYKEITKWLGKLPLRPGNESKYEDFAKALQIRLKSTSDQRKCILEKSKTKSKKDKAKSKTKKLTKKSKDVKLPGSSGVDKTSTQAHNISEYRETKKNSADQIYDIVHAWCEQLPIDAKNLEHAQSIKDDLTTKMIIKISELNTNPEIFNNDVFYDKLLGEELQRLLATIPTSCEFSNTKISKINQLRQNISCLKPRIVEERASHKYRQDLIKKLDIFLEKSESSTLEKNDQSKIIKNDIVDDYILYKCSNNDNEDKQIHKINIQDNISKYNLLNSKSNTSVNKNEPKITTLMKANHIISELSKIVPKNNNILRDEAEEIRMKKEVSDFFDEMGVTSKDDKKIKHLKGTLAKKLNDLELNGHNPENENKMKQEILKCLKKLGFDKNPVAVDAFITKLKDNEMARRTPINIVTEDDNIDSKDRNYKESCPFKKQNLRNVYANPPVVISNHAPGNFARRPPCSSKYSPQFFQGKSIDYNKRCQRAHNKKENGPYEEKEGIPVEDMPWTSDEASSSEEDKRICLCKKSNSGRHKRRPYCMVPLRYICESRDVLNSLWCGMPLPLF